MRLVAWLALRDLLRQRVHLVCNIAVIAGVLVPLLVLFGVKNGVYEALIGRLLANPATLQVDTSGNNVFTQADADAVAGWPETGFVTLKTRALFDFVNARKGGGGPVRDALLVPSGTGDPMLGVGTALPPGTAAITTSLAEQLGLGVGDMLDIITQAEGRQRQLLLPLTVSAVLPGDRMTGRAVLTDIAALDLVEAFYDGYALPDHGITAGRPIAERAPSFEGLRVFARDLESLAALQTRLESRFGIRTEARTREVETVLNLGRNLNLALALTAGVASVGLAGALVFGFWGEVARNRTTLAVLGLMGIGRGRIWLFPMVQALVSAVMGLAVSFALFWAAAQATERLFATGLTDRGGLVVLEPGQVGVIVAAVLGFVALSAVLAARSAARIDPASVLREASS